MADVFLQLHPTKTRIVYCRDDRREETYPSVKFDALGYEFRPRAVWGTQRGRLFCGVTPAVSAAQLRLQRVLWPIVFGITAAHLPAHLRPRALPKACYIGG